ncbi:hypothetical protein [Streptomyces yaizuensis]|uniref:Uncharacterized protein n=1 Tax=Streptomyces yaizuensis TaxID=2989713 RepID=A0ABQ5P1Q1_9ACTN|nr:hypothetical protein [Streptomyces sp. YSPA8]GLF96510.1 hypothetical protein SYYSPA8_19455 [Streptomyces sp. YSPA8]
MPEPAQPTLVDELRSSLDVLSQWTTYPWPDVATIAGHTGTAVRDALTACGVWDRLPECERAAAHWCLADSLRLRHAWTQAVERAGYEPLVARFRADVAHFAAKCDPHGAARWPEADPERVHQGEIAVYLWGAFRRLRAEWRASVLDQVAPVEPPPVLLTGAPRPAAPLARPTLAAALALAGAKAERDQDPPPRRSGSRTYDTAVVADRIGRLPTGWQVETVRRIAAGADPLIVSSEAAQAINMLRSVGVRIGWNAAPEDEGSGASGC